MDVKVLNEIATKDPLLIYNFFTECGGKDPVVIDDILKTMYSYEGFYNANKEICDFYFYDKLKNYKLDNIENPVQAIIYSIQQSNNGKE